MRVLFIISISLVFLLTGCGTLPNSGAPVVDTAGQSLPITGQCNAAPPTAQPMPAMFSNEDVIKEIQARLILLGYSTGRIDGIYGKRTEQGIRDYQAANHLLIDGLPTEELLEHIISTQRTRGVDLSGFKSQIVSQTIE